MRRAYAQATPEFLAWCERAGVASIADLKPPHVAAYIEQLSREQSTPTVKQSLAAIRGTDKLTTTPLPQANAYSMIRRRGVAPGIVGRAEPRRFCDRTQAS
jgi:integrase/recombinase XerC